MRRLVPLVALTCLALLAGAAGLPAAGASATVTIDSPADGSVFAAPYSGPIDVTFTGVGGESYGVSVIGPDGYAWSTSVTPAADGQQSFPIPAATNDGVYTAQVADATPAVLASASFTVSKPNAAQVVSPTPGSTVAAGFAGPVDVSWTSVSNVGHGYRVEVLDAAAAVVASCDYAGAGLEATTTSCGTGVLGTGSYSVAVSDTTTATQFVGASFDVAPPPTPKLRFLGVRASPRSFYPLRRDGYRDTTHVSFVVSISARVSLRVVDRRGRVVRRVRLGTVRGGSRHVWRWRGVTAGGKRLHTGRYVVKLRARAGSQRVRAKGVTVRIRTGWLTRRGRHLVRGDRYAAITSSGNCRHKRSKKALLMACAGPASIVATYRFRLPANTTRAAGGIAGFYTGARSRVFSRGRRPSKRRFEVLAGIQQRRGTTGLGVVVAGIRYRYRVRI